MAEETKQVVKGYIFTFEEEETLMTYQGNEMKKYKNVFIAEYTLKGATKLFYAWYEAKYHKMPKNVFTTTKRLKKAQKLIYTDEFVKQQWDYLGGI